jgi:sugar lactone lactonase YvrE
LHRAGGIWLHDKQGNVLARLKVPGHPTNFGFGDDDWRSIFVTTVGNVVRTRVNVPGVPGW